MSSRGLRFRIAREAVRLTFCLPHKKLAKRSPSQKNRLIYYERFSPRGTQTHSSLVVARTGFLKGLCNENLP